MKVVLRPHCKEDEPFIFATYLRNRWFDRNNKTTLKRSTWSAMQHRRLEDRLGKNMVLVACLDEDNDTILGYAFRDDDGPYCYVKLSFRSEGFNVKERLFAALGDVNANY